MLQAALPEVGARIAEAFLKVIKVCCVSFILAQTVAVHSRLIIMTIMCLVFVCLSVCLCVCLSDCLSISLFMTGRPGVTVLCERLISGHEGSSAEHLLKSCILSCSLFCSSHPAYHAACPSMIVLLACYCFTLLLLDRSIGTAISLLGMGFLHTNLSCGSCLALHVGQSCWLCTACILHGSAIQSPEGFLLPQICQCLQTPVVSCRQSVCA